MLLDKLEYVKRYIGSEELLKLFIEKNNLTQKDKEKLQWAYEELKKDIPNTIFIDEAYTLLLKVNSPKYNSAPNINTDKINENKLKQVLNIANRYLPKGSLYLIILFIFELIYILNNTEQDISLSIGKAFAVIIALVVIIMVLPEKENYEMEMLDVDNFLSLPQNLRKLALSYAWNDVLKSIHNIPITSETRGTATAVLVLLAILSGFMTFYKLTEGNIEFFVAVLTMTMLFAYFAYKSGLEAKYAVKKEEYDKKKRRILQNLAVNFINENVDSWIQSCRNNYIDENILLIADLKPEEQYVLYSYDISILSDDRMPPEKIHLTYVLVDNYISVIDNISININSISYSFLEKDTMDCDCTKKDDWNSEEFHYQDIIEIGYKTNDNTDDEVEYTGSAFISLASGTTKEYPASKKYTNNLFTDVRARVRESKLH